jgi:hypothetical protein
MSFLSDSAKLAYKKLTGKRIDVSDIPFHAIINMIPPLRRAVNKSCEQNKITIDEIVDFVSADIPKELEAPLANAEAYILKKYPNATEEQRLLAMQQECMPAINAIKEKATQTMLMRIIHFTFGLLPDKWQAIALENLRKFGQTLDSSGKLLTGQGNKEAYKDFTYGLLCEGEKQIVSAFKYLDEQTGGKSSLTIRMEDAKTETGKVIMVDVNMRMPDNSLESKTIHFPEVGDFIIDTIDRIRERDAQKQLQANPQPTIEAN